MGGPQRLSFPRYYGAMDEECLKKKKFIVSSASGIEVAIDFLNPAYKLSEMTPDVTTGNTGRLQLLRIDPIPAGLPAFCVRIGHDDHEAIDVDLIGDKAQRLAFARKAPGYVGHKTDRLETDPRSYKLDIAVPSVGRILSGTLTMKGVGLGLRLGFDSLAETLTDAVVTRAGDNPAED